MKYETIFIKEKLSQIGVSLDDVSLGDFQEIGEFTARKRRDPGSDLWKKVGSRFSPNLERGILIYELIKKHKLTSYLEIGFGRGYSALCAAKAFQDLGNGGEVMVVEPYIDDDHMNMISKMFPEQWLNRLQVAKGTSAEVLPKLQSKFDLIYIDGDHTKEAVKFDFENLKNKFEYFMLLDDYRVDDPQTSIEVAEALEEVTLDDKWKVELVKMDRRLFLDDRGIKDEDLKYGQILLTDTEALEQRSKEPEVKFEW